jgi:hypothetical protein
MFSVCKERASHKGVEDSMATLANSGCSIEVSSVAHRRFESDDHVWSIRTHNSNELTIRAFGTALAIARPALTLVLQLVGGSAP